MTEIVKRVVILNLWKVKIQKKIEKITSSKFLTSRNFFCTVLFFVDHKSQNRIQEL